MPDSIHNWRIDRDASGEPAVVTDLCYSPDDGGWYGHQINFKTHKSRNTKRVHTVLSSLEFDLDEIGSDTKRGLWERWR